jgi:enamine deaminase RidA (YjgF/YER057c/UK114 family)
MTLLHLKISSINIFQEFLKLAPYDRLKSLPMKRSCQIYKELGLPSPPYGAAIERLENSSKQQPVAKNSCMHVTYSSDDFVLVSNIFGSCSNPDNDSVQRATNTAMDNLKDALLSCDLTFGDVFMIHLYVKDMSQFAVINGIYKEYFGINPPAR